MSSSMGLDYFNIDINIFSDGKILKLMNRYGPVGFISYITILAHVYANGYYLEYSIEDTHNYSYQELEVNTSVVKTRFKN